MLAWLNGAFGASGTAVVTPVPPRPTEDPKANQRREVYKRYVLPEVETLLRVALSMCNQPSDAEDLVQETLLSAWRGIDGFDGRHPRAWLLTILRNAHQKMHRRQRPGLLHDPDAALEGRHAMQPQASAEDIVVERTLEATIDRALRELPEGLRQVVVLVDIHRFSYAETAIALGISPGTVPSRLYRARSRIRDLLSADGVRPHDAHGGPKARR